MLKGTLQSGKWLLSQGSYGRRQELSPKAYLEPLILLPLPPPPAPVLEFTGVCHHAQCVLR